MQSVIQILKVNEVKKGTSKKTGNDYELQECECLLLTADGEVDQVGVLMVPKALREVVAKGVFTGTFALRANPMDRRIGAVLTGLTAIPAAALGRRDAPASVAASSSK